MSLKHQVISGVAWRTLARVVQQAAQLLLSVMLARLLFPEDFGLFQMVLVFAGFGELFTAFGFAAALVQLRNLEDRHLHSIFWLTIALGSAMSVVFVLASSYIATFYNQPLLMPICHVLAFTYVLGSFGIVPHALLQRRMSFEALAKVEIVVTLLSGVFAVVLALLGWGVWSLVAQSLCAACLRNVLYFVVSGWRPRFLFNPGSVKELSYFSINLFGFNALNYWARNADNLIIGKLLGAGALGIYNRAYGLMLLPVSQIISVVSDVMFTALCSIKDDKPRVKRIYLKGIGIIALLCFPIMAGMYVVAEPFILSVYGTKWAAVVPVLQILCVVGFFQSINSPTGWIYTSQGRTDWMMWWGVFGSGTLVVGIIIGAMFGTVLAIAIGYTIANCVIFYPCNKIPGKLINMKFNEIIQVIGAQFCCSVVMAVCVWMIGQALPSNVSSWLRLAVQVLSGLVVYCSLVSFFKITAYQHICQLLSEQWFSSKTINSTVKIPNLV